MPEETLILVPKGIINTHGESVISITGIRSVYSVLSQGYTSRGYWVFHYSDGVKICGCERSMDDINASREELMTLIMEANANARAENDL